MVSCPSEVMGQFSRRRFLSTGMVAASLALGTQAFPALAQSAAYSEARLAEFMRASFYLTGRTDLLRAQGLAAFLALSERFPNFDQSLSQFTTFLRERNMNPSNLQSTLDEAGAEFAWLPRQIVSSWYLGVVGAVQQPADAEAGLTPPAAVEGAPALRGIAWEQALMFIPLAGTLPIPSYAFQGDWAVKPGNGD